jgi:hypothetical protein
VARSVFVHVGAPKTGTSYLQSILWSNRKALREAGYLLPGTRRAHYKAMGDLRGAPWFDPEAFWTWDRIAEKSAAWDGTVIISEEMLGAATPEQAASALERLQPADLHIIVTARDLARTIPSAWQQGVRARATGTFTSFVRGLQTNANPGFWSHQAPLPILERWGRTVPPANRHLVVLPPPGSDRSLLWDRFAQVLDLEPGLVDTTVWTGNPSLGGAEAELLRRVNAGLGSDFPLSAPYLDVVRGYLTHPVLMRGRHDYKFGMPAEMFPWVQDTSRRMVEELRGYPCEVVGDIEELVPSAPGDPGVSPDELPDEVLLETAVESIVGLLRNTDRMVSDLSRDHDELVAELRGKIQSPDPRSGGRAHAVRRRGRLWSARVRLLTALRR